MAKPRKRQQTKVGARQKRASGTARPGAPVLELLLPEDRPKGREYVLRHISTRTTRQGSARLVRELTIGALHGPDGAPDWRDATTYEYTKSHDAHAWAWERLRRIPEYREDWHRERSRFLESQKRLPAALRANVAPDHALFSIPSAACREKWDLFNGMFNPDDAAPLGLCFAGGELYDGPGTLTMPPGKVAVILDPAWPIDPQLERVREQCRFAQSDAPRSTRNRAARWVDFLRALDARAAGAKRREIGGVILGKSDEYPDNAATKAGSKLLQAAQRWARGYRSIL